MTGYEFHSSMGCKPQKSSLHVFWMVFETVHELLDFQISFTYIVYGSEQWKPGIKKKIL